MKWGVHKSKQERQDEYVRRYKEKEIKRLKAESDWNTVRSNKRINKDGNKYNRALAKYGQPEDPNKGNKATKAGAKFIDTVAKARTRERVLQEQAKKVVSMNLEDIKAEKKQLGKKYAEAALLNMASFGAMGMGSPVGLFRKVNDHGVKASMRVKPETIKKIYDEEFANVANQVYREQHGTDMPVHTTHVIRL